MNPNRLQSELWETQVWLMWILALGLYETKHMVLFWVVLVWSVISFAGAFIKALQARAEDLLANKEK